MEKYYSTIVMSIISLAISVNLFATGQKQVSGNSNKGILAYYEGTVFINDIPGDIGDEVTSSDTLRTGEESYCEVVFGDSNVFSLEENTVTRINWDNSDIQLKKGAISAVFTKLDKFLNDDKDFTISTTSTVAGIRGTVFFIKVEDEENTYLCICNGKLNITKRNEILSVSSAHHKAYRFTKVNDSVTTTNAKMLYHDDDKMEKVAKRIEYTIPWEDGTYKDDDYKY